LSIWAFTTPCKKDGFGDFNYIGLSESQSRKPYCKNAPHFTGEPVPPCKGKDCGSHGSKKDCPEDSLGYGEACDPKHDKCCGSNVGFRKVKKLTCLGDGSYCPSCK